MKILEIKEQSETSYKMDLSDHLFLELLNKKTKNSHRVMTMAPIFTVSSGSDIMLMTPELSPKKISKFWIDSIIKTSPHWKKFPDREHSIRAFTERTRAGTDPYVVIPFDRSRVGISLKSSFYKSFSEVERSLNLDRVDNAAILSWVKNISSAVNKLSGEDLNTEIMSYSSFESFLKNLDKVIIDNRGKIVKNLQTNTEITEEESQVMSDLMSRFVTSTMLYLKEKFDPDSNGFKVIPIESFHEVEDREVWIASPCLLIKQSKYVELFKQGKI
jgi:hypothetical protein